MQVMSRPRPLLLYGAVVSLLAIGVFFLPGIGPALLSTNGFAPHGVCILWQPGLLWFHVTNDLLIGTSYVAIATTLAYLVYKGRRDLPFHWLLLAFGAFIISCGSTHFTEVITFWQPLYWLSGYTKLVTAVASVATAIALPPLVPRVLDLVAANRLAEERKAQLELANAELAQLNSRLRELDELKSQLFANVSHELRTPLTLILGPTEGLLALATPEQRPALETIERNARLLQRHVEDLLDVARLENGRLDLRQSSLDLSALTRSTADIFSGAAEQRHFAFAVETPPTLMIEADGEQLQRVLINLIANAFKFTPDGGTVAVAVSSDGERATIKVDDSGPGVSAALRPFVFERFRQGESGSTRRYGGTGLGLAIARELVVLHGGTIEVATSALGGASFTVTLPVGRPAAPQAPVPAPQAIPVVAPEATEVVPGAGLYLDANRPRLLVVEDNAELRHFLLAALAAEYEVAAATDGRSGLAQALALRPDLIVSDVMMPEASGEELVAALRQHPELREIPVVMLTARADSELRVKLLSGGAQDYLLKPFAVAELRARLANLLATARARATLREALASREGDLTALSAEAARLYAEAKAALSLRDEFLSIAAHELRTPVTALLGNAQLLVRRWERDGLDPARDQRAIRAIGLLSERLTGMIETLLDVTRIDRHQLTLELAPLNLTDLARAQVELVLPTLQRHQLRLEAPPAPLMVNGDAERLQQVLGNLLSNAVKYSPEGGLITVRVGERDGLACISVEDQGLGIPAEAHGRLFERFYRAPNIDSRSISGFGIGLYLAREILTLHGGTIEVASVEGAGSTFTACLPLWKDEG